MYTKEALLTNSTMSKIRLRQGNREPIKGVLSKEEVQAKNPGHIEVYTNVDTGDFFFTDDYCLGTDYMPKQWVPSSCQLPMKVVERECLPSGWVNTIDDYILIFHHDGRLIESIDELIDILNGENRGEED